MTEIYGPYDIELWRVCSRLRSALTWEKERNLPAAEKTEVMYRDFFIEMTNK